jgi:hypothetical protein
MRLSHERCVHLSHQVINLLEDDDQVEFLRDPNDIRLKVLQILEGEMARQDELEESIRRRIATQRRDIPEGSAEWEVLFRKYYEDEMKKVKRVRE